MPVTINNPLSVIVQQAKASGKKFTTGTVTFATNNGNQTITHNLGVTPSVFIMLAKPDGLNFTFNAEDAPAQGLYGFIMTSANYNLSNIFYGSSVSNAYTKGGFCLQWNPTTTGLRWNIASTIYGAPTETTVNTGYSSSATTYRANLEYTWIAIE